MAADDTPAHYAAARPTRWRTAEVRSGATTAFWS